MLHNILTIFTKEFREVLRDRKTLIFMIVIPTVAVPLLIVGMTKIMINVEKKASESTLRYALIGGQYLPELAKRFSQHEKFEEVVLATEDDLEPAINEGTVKFGIVLPENARETLDKGLQLDVKLYFNNASVTSKVESRASDVVQEFSDDVRDGRLEEIGVTGGYARTNLLEPLAIQEVGTADMREVLGERIGGLLPYLFIIFSFIGALYPAIDLGAGEKERGTLETLLLTPVPRLQLVLGKFLVIFSTGVISSVLSVTGMGIYLLTQGQKVQGMMGEIMNSVSALDLALIGAMLIPIAAIFAALLMSISIYAKSFKEAQSYATPFNFLCILPAVIAMIPGIELNWKWAMVPITNVALAIKELVKGTMDYQVLVAILGSTSLLAIALIAFSTKWFERESVLFRE